MATNVSNTSILPDSSFKNLTDFSFSPSTLIICNTGGFISLVANGCLLGYAKLNFNFKDPFDGPLLRFLTITVCCHILLALSAIVGYFEDSYELWSCRIFSLLLNIMAFTGTYFKSYYLIHLE